MISYQGECYCQKVTFTCEGEPLFTQICHCEKCREVAASSSRKTDHVGYAYTAAYLTNHFTIDKGENAIQAITRNNAKLLLCAICHSLIYGISLDPSKQGGIGVNVNNIKLDDPIPDSFKPVRHVWYANHIIEINDNLPKFKDAPKEQFGSGELL
tara:strand:- start:5 stop:469 length:465 start_codon:yes stop_codon:yes gene_type:complete